MLSCLLLAFYTHRSSSPSSSACRLQSPTTWWSQDGPPVALAHSKPPPPSPHMRLWVHLMCLFTSISLLLLTIFSQTPTTFGLTITFLAIILLLNTIFPSFIISCFFSSSSSHFHFIFIFTPAFIHMNSKSSLSSSNSYAASLCFCCCLVNSHTERHVNINAHAQANIHEATTSQWWEMHWFRLRINTTVSKCCWEIILYDNGQLSLNKLLSTIATVCVCMCVFCSCEIILICLKLYCPLEDIVYHNRFSVANYQ